MSFLYSTNVCLIIVYTEIICFDNMISNAAMRFIKKNYVGAFTILIIF